MVNQKLEAKERKICGRKVKKLRREGILPANLYGKKIKSQALQVPLRDFQKVYKEAGETKLIDLKVGTETFPVLIHNVQLHPVTGEPFHIDFHHVSLKEKTTAMVPVEITGESPAVKQGIGVLIQPISELEVEAFPQDLPEHLVVDISRLSQVDDQVTVSEIEVDREKVLIKADPSQIVAKIGPLEKEEVISPAPAEEAVPIQETPVEEVKPEEKPVEEETENK